MIDNSESDDFGNFYIKPSSEILLKTDENVTNNSTFIEFVFFEILKSSSISLSLFSVLLVFRK